MATKAVRGVLVNSADLLAQALAAANDVIAEMLALLAEGSAELDEAFRVYKHAVERAEPVLRHYQHLQDVLN